MIKTTLYQLNPARLIEEIKKRPGLYRTEQPADREEKLHLWKEVGAAIYDDWDSFNKATAYDRVLQLQRKWRSLRDAYNRELRARRAAPRGNRRVYIYFKRMSFLGGFEGSVSDDDDQDGNQVIFSNQTEDPLFSSHTSHTPRRKRRKKSSSDGDQAPEELEMPVFPVDISDDGDSDKLFLLSFLPEMKQLPANIKMWARAQIANVMQEAVNSHFNNSIPGSSSDRNGMVKQRRDSSE
ncbi:uncharacterized protein LOC113394143 [Vanessa tameamea]|uniref:Uncharacterized protein LOC113394143 n=1 Tax=Vanessa tameamea TaxID=334116 RepID=A0A8B8HQM5_VANTA|nr:uncharacterized protein LOC113394143 [Vanessa tameamea]XP_046963774.1 uncharacterized protein LOC124532758 [Vanessa cardui]XP_047538222.1 uncharacterized protein LOC125071856 [Vanessa atalanta]